jgi:hypothetical protein
VMVTTIDEPLTNYCYANRSIIQSIKSMRAQLFESGSSRHR